MVDQNGQGHYCQETKFEITKGRTVPRPHQLLSLFLALGLLSFFGCHQKEQSLAKTMTSKPLKVVFVTGDEEYRSEESMPMLAKILERDFNIKTTVAYALSDAGEISPNRSDNIDGLEELEDADLLVMFTRFRRLPDRQLKMITDYVDSGRPLVGFRTSTHAFKYPKENPNAPAMNNVWPIQTFGQKWITHHGHFADGKETMTSVTLMPSKEKHVILRGVKPFAAHSWLYHVEGGGDKLHGDCDRLLMGHATRSNHMKNLKRFPLDTPVAWTKTNTTKDSDKVRVFFTTLGHPFDFKNKSMRTLALNGILWALGKESWIPEGGCRSDLAAKYDPPNSGFGQVYRKGVFPRK